jgi:hypothetical protein
MRATLLKCRRIYLQIYFKTHRSLDCFLYYAFSLVKLVREKRWEEHEQSSKNMKFREMVNTADYQVLYLY